MIEKPSYITLVQFFKGEASREEVGEVTSWQQENVEEFKELQSIWDQYGSLATTYKPDLDRAWSEIDNRTQSTRPNWILRIAAMLVLGLGLGWIIEQSWVSSPAEPHLYQAMNENLTIELSDQTVVILAAGSSLELQDGYGVGNRRTILSGKAYFEVSSNESLPFQVEINEMQVSVLGTAFEVEEGPEVIEVTVTEGMVSVMVSSESIEVSSNEIAVYDVENASLTKSVDVAENHLAWKSLVLSFTNTDLDDFARDLADFYDVEIELSKALKDRKITAEFNNQPLSEVFEIIQATLDVEVDTVGNAKFRLE